MRIVHINLMDFQGGAARISSTLMDYMTKKGHEAYTFAHRKTSIDERVIPLPFLHTKWQKKLLEIQKREGLFDLYSAALLGLIEHPLFESADIVHLHCINKGYFSFLLLPFLTAKPTVWTLHDSLAFTAGCLHSEFCDGWKNNLCLSCPLDINDQKPKRQLVQKLKETIYEFTDFTVVCPSKWLTEQAKESILKEHDIRLIHNGIDIDVFKPANKIAIRNKLGLSINKKIIMFAADGGFYNQLKGGQFLIEALHKLKDIRDELLLICIGTYNNSVVCDTGVECISIPYISNKETLADYYRAADIFVTPSLAENLGLTILEALASETPVVAFKVGGTPEIITHKENGYLAPRGNSEKIAAGIRYFLDEAIRQKAGQLGRKTVVNQFNDKDMASKYERLYEELLTKHPSYFVVPNLTDISQLVQKSTKWGWGFVWIEFTTLYNNFENSQLNERAIFTDQFFNECLKSANIISDTTILWKIVDMWQLYRLLPERGSTLPAEEKRALIEFCHTLRDKIYEYFINIPLDILTRLSDYQQDKLCNIWKKIFFNAFFQLDVKEVEWFKEEIKDKLNGDKLSHYFALIVISMYCPFAADQYDINPKELWDDNDVPLYVKGIITSWMLNTPYYGINELDRQRILKYTPEICKVNMPINLFVPIINEFVENLWRIAYVGGNNLEVLSAFGDFISSNMKRIFPKYASYTPIREVAKEKIRIGYISRFFYSQAVSYYMVNRVIHHDKDNFEVYVFALGNKDDNITKTFQENAEHFLQFKEIGYLENMHEIMQSVIDSKLDILIYTDIGMDPLTFMLAGLKLAPIQCVMVGHGATSGLPTIDYYLSGDFELPEADLHYREKLKRLPNLGAAQLPPPFAEDIPITRKDWKIPDEAVVFVSCANGIKHGANRDSLLVEILKRAPNACILLKPCHQGNYNSIVGERIMAAAKKAGVANRLLIVPPLGRVDALLAIADIQLDTYPYGGWTTNMEALYMGIPIVTQEGTMAQSRWGAGMLRALGITEGIAANENQYIEWAVCLAQDEDLRIELKEKIISQAREVLFNGAKAQVAFEKALRHILQNTNS